jgi:hypothetical protein
MLGAACARALSGATLVLVLALTPLGVLISPSIAASDKYRSYITHRPGGFDILGFSRSAGRNGVIVYSCQAEWCGPGSVVTYKRQKNRRPFTEGEFQAHAGSVRFEVFKSNAEQLEDVQLGGCDYVPSQYVTIGDCILKLRPKPGSSLKHEVYFTGFLALDGQLFTTASSASRTGDARRNGEVVFFAITEMVVTKARSRAKTR